MALSNLNKETLTNLFKMLSVNDNNTITDNIKKDSITYAQLELIYNQINLLKIQADLILKNHFETFNINNINSSFKKVPGNYYYLYKNKGNFILSLVHPEESIIYDEFISKYYYDYDLTFKRIDN